MPCPCASPPPHAVVQSAAYRTIPYTSLALGRRLGGGAFGDVFEAVLNGDTMVAVKANRVEAADARATDREGALLAALPLHQNVITTFGICSGA